MKLFSFIKKFFSRKSTETVEVENQTSVAKSTTPTYDVFGDKIDAYDAAIADGGGSIELQETQETHLDDGPTPRLVEEPDFTAEELEEFKRLNKIEDLHENNGPTDVVLEPNEVIVTEQPTETKVKKVKVTKPKTSKTSKSPRGPKTKK